MPSLRKPEVISIKGTKPNRECRLIGLVQSYVPYRDTAVSLQTGKPKVIFEENSGLASVLPIDVVEDCVRLEQQRIKGKK